MNWSIVIGIVLMVACYTAGHWQGWSGAKRRDENYVWRCPRMDYNAKLELVTAIRDCEAPATWRYS